MKLTIMQGLPGSGKSTHAAKLKGAVVFSADDYFVELGGGVYKFDPSKLGEAHGRCFRKCVEAMQNKVGHIVIDNTNTTPEEVAPYMALANAYGYEARILRVEGAPDVCAKRNTHGVPVQAILAMAARLATFKGMPWWKLETV
jgi:predicted kinase